MMSGGWKRIAASAAVMLLLNIPAAVEASAQPSIEDLQRARTKKPRKEYQGHGTLSSANAQLNSHLRVRQGLKTLACESHSIRELRGTLKTLFQMRNPELVATYPQGDGRFPAYNTVTEMEAHWATLPTEDEKVRDAHCHEAVMWFVHHLTTPLQAEFAQAKENVLPLLPLREHARDGEDTSTKLYAKKATCQQCHVGGIPDQGKPEVMPKSTQELSRRCYTNYKDLFNLTCGPCDGLSGISYGDEADQFDAPKCEIVGYPKDIPESQRVKAKMPTQFSVTLHGSDRMGRTTNPEHSANIIGEVYGTMVGEWNVNIQPHADQWFLRHDVNFSQMYLKGHKLPLVGKFLKETEIHVQSEAERKANVTGAMVTMLYGVPDQVPGGCTCIPDPVGVPDFSTSEAKGIAEMEYMGRIKLTLDFSKEVVEVDHWAGWFIHMFMDTNKNDPSYGKAPRRIGSAYAGLAEYHDWKFVDPKTLYPDIWYRGIPTHKEIVGPDHGKYCMNPLKYPLCNNISQSTYPPPPDKPVEPAQQWARENAEQNGHLFPMHAGLQKYLLAMAQAEAEKQVFV